MSFLGLLQINQRKKPISELTPTIQKKNPIFNITLPSTEEELEELEIILGKKMSEVNFKMNQSIQNMILLEQKGDAVQAIDQRGLKIMYQQELRELSKQLMEVVHKRNEIYSNESSRK